MATELQKNLAREIVKNSKRKKPLNKKELVVSSGYSESTASQQIPAVFEQKGVLEELDNLGFTEDAAKKVVQDIMLNEYADPNTRLKATDQVFKVTGSYKDAPTTNIHLNTISVTFEEKEAINKALDAIDS